MAGSLRAVPGRPNTWELRVYLGRDAGGRVRHRHARFVGSRRAAERELARFVTEQEAAPAPVPEEPRKWGPATTLNDAIAAWRDNGWDDLSPKTTRNYESMWRVHIKGSIGRRKIATLGTYDIERFYRSLKAQGLSQATVRQVKAVVHRACRLAHKWSGGTLPNPGADADLPAWRIEERRAEVRAPDVDEVRALIAAGEAQDIRFGVLVRLLAATGMRRGEACALRWSDIDAERGVITVDESVIGAKGGAIVKAPKTRASIRELACDAATLVALERLRAEQERLAAACGQSLAPESFLLSYQPGGAVPPHPDTFSSAMTRLRKKAGLPADIHLHSLRHFHATALDPVISERQKQARLGWSTVHMARHYTDGVPAEDRRAAEHVGRLLAGAADTSPPHVAQKAAGAGA
ncbi:MAG: tyrosine-type recombinase/integrase [Acidimicrobiales bacterium]